MSRERDVTLSEGKNKTVCREPDQGQEDKEVVMDFRLEGTKASAGREIDASEKENQETGKQGEGEEEGKKVLEF